MAKIKCDLNIYYMKLSIIVSFRKREEHLKVFLDVIKNRVKENFDVLIVEQDNEKPFNKGKLSNIGFDIKKNSSDYFCFHDVDMIPQEDVDYSYTETVTHLASKVSQFSYKLPAYDYFGGVILFNKGSFEKINGFSNDYWGWGGEDNDLYLRVTKNKIEWNRKECTFESLPHKKNYVKVEHDENVKKLYSNYDFNLDGLNNLSYKISDSKKINDFTDHIKVDF